MLEQKTLFIVGAGASRDFRFPIGTGLRAEIIEYLRPHPSRGLANDSLMRILQRYSESRPGGDWAQDHPRFVTAAREMRNGLSASLSIDSFIDSRADDDITFLGKLAIAAVISQHEKDSGLAPLSGADANDEGKLKSRENRIGESWHILLCHMLFEGHRVDTAHTVFENASFIIFNYDRCIEQMLRTFLQRRFGLAAGSAYDILSQAKIIHPYGQTGTYFPSQDGYVSFGEVEEHQLIGISEKLRTFTETIESGVASNIRDKVAEASTIVFMGFGWLPQNMRLPANGKSIKCK